MALYPLTVFFDGACPICAREIAVMKRLDRRGRLFFCDFSRPDYHAATTGLSPETLSVVIHGRWANGIVITGIEVFRGMWEAVGLGGLVWLSRLSLVEPLLQRGYAWFARNRLWLTGRKNSCTGKCHAATPSKPVATGT